jgi:hypothetical protein
VQDKCKISKKKGKKLERGVNPGRGGKVRYLLEGEGGGKHGFRTCGFIDLPVTEQAMLYIKNYGMFFFILVQYGLLKLKVDCPRESPIGQI